MADLVCDKDEQVVEDFYWYLLHSTAANAFPEGIVYKAPRLGQDHPARDGACNYAFLLRHMLVHEQGDDSTCCTPCPTGGSAKAGKSASKGCRLLRRYDLSIRGIAKGVEAKLDKPVRRSAGQDCLAPAREPAA